MSCEYTELTFYAITTTGDMEITETALSCGGIKGQLELSSYRSIESSTLSKDQKFFNFFPENYAVSGIILRGMTAKNSTDTYIVENVEEYSDHIEIILRLEAA